ncbi:MAG: FAD binding domain-containing protein [Bdellovibrionaceae bacterium]|nr:FAD binding domain-containing protein [Pseudobdellovibrionaceae bacterium]
MRDHVVFYLNGERHEVRSAECGQMLADYLRYHLGMTGTKIVCAEGDCGACTVLRRYPLAESSKGANCDSRTRYLAINSCVALVAQMDGSSLVTVDALAMGTELTPVQASMVQCHGSQCGFCTPGFVMALTGAIEKKCAKKSTATRDKSARLTEREARNALTGNLCRCTGYQQILEAAMDVNIADCTPVSQRFYSRAQERDLLAATSEAVHIQSPEFEFYAPRTLKDAAKFRARHPDARILGSGTDLGVTHNKRKVRLTRVLSLHLIPELYEIREAKNGTIRLGARVTLSETRHYLKSRSPEFARYLDIFASPQIKHVATLAGNVANASPIGDTPPALLAMGAVVHVVGTKGKRDIPIAEFFLGYRQTALKPGELIAAISFRPTSKNETLAVYKVSERKDLDISSVNAGFWLRWSDGRSVANSSGKSASKSVGKSIDQSTGRQADASAGALRIAEARVAYGGVAANPLRLKKTEAALIGQTRQSLDVELLSRVLQSEIEPISDVRGSAAFRRVLAENLLRRFIRELP